LRERDAHKSSSRSLPICIVSGIGQPIDNTSMDFEDMFYVVDEILGHISVKGNHGKPPKIWYLVSWSGYPPSNNNYVKEKHFNEIDLLKEYQLANNIASQ